MASIPARGRTTSAPTSSSAERWQLRLSSSPLQTGNESMYAVPPIYMLQSRDFLVPRFEGGIFLDKPPLAHWFIAGSYGLFGISVASERLPGALASLATVLAVYLWVRRRSGER